MRAAIAPTYAHFVGLPPRYHTLPAHLIEIAAVLVVALFIGWVVHRRGSRPAASLTGPVTYRCLPDDGSPLFEHAMIGTTIGTAFVHDGRRYVISAPASVAGKSAIRVKRVDREVW
jgi:hypothetical protein